MDFGGLGSLRPWPTNRSVKVHQLKSVEGGAVEDFQGHQLVVPVLDLAGRALHWGKIAYSLRALRDYCDQCHNSQ